MFQTNENSTQELSSDSELETNESYTARDLIDGEVDDGYTTEEEEVIPGVQSKCNVNNSYFKFTRLETIYQPIKIKSWEYFYTSSWI